MSVDKVWLIRRVSNLGVSVYVGELANGGRMPGQLMRASGLVVTAPIGLNIAQVNKKDYRSITKFFSSCRALFSPLFLFPERYIAVFRQRLRKYSGTKRRFCKLSDGTSYTTEGDFFPHGATCGMECEESYLPRSFEFKS